MYAKDDSMTPTERYYQDLKNLGITAWLPRAQLDGAGATPEWVYNFQFGELPSEPVKPKATPTSKGDARAHLAKLRSVLDGPSAEVTPIVEPQVATSDVQAESPNVNAGRQALAKARGFSAPPASVVSEPITNDVHVEQPKLPEDREIPNFQFAFVCYGKLLVIDAVPPNARDGFGPIHKLLQQKIVGSLGIDEQPTSDVSLLKWPLFNRPGIDQSRPEAIKAVKRKLDWVYKKQQPEYVLIMGEAAAQIVLERKEPIASLKGLEFTLQGGEPGVKAVATHSLSEALQLAWVKPEIWRDIQPLVRCFNGQIAAK